MLQIQTRNKAKNKNKDSPHPRSEVKSYIFFFPLVGFGIVNLPFTIIQINQDWQEILFQDIHLVVPPSHAQIYWLPPLANVHAIYHYVSFFAAKPNTDRPVTEKSKMDVFPPPKKIPFFNYYITVPSFIHLRYAKHSFRFFFPLFLSFFCLSLINTYCFAPFFHEFGWFFVPNSRRKAPLLFLLLDVLYLAILLVPFVCPDWCLWTSNIPPRHVTILAFDPSFPFLFRVYLYKPFFLRFFFLYPFTPIWLVSSFLLFRIIYVFFFCLYLYNVISFFLLFFLLLL